MRDWMFSSVMSGLRAGEERLERLRVLVEEVADADDFKANAEVGGKLAAVVDGALRGVGAGHADADHVFRAQRVGGDGGDERGVDAAAERDEGFAEAAFAHVVARAENQGAIGGFGVVFIWIGDRRPHRRDRRRPDLLRTRRPGAMSSPCALRASEEPSKMRLSLPPTWLHISTGMPSRRAMAASISRRMVRLECQKGDEERLMWRAGFWRISSSMGSTE